MHDLLNSFVQILLFANILYSEKASSLWVTNYTTFPLAITAVFKLF
jgi:hypothetical protein